ncbi:MAG: hypothetical protein LBR65_02515 [Culturomica sp.]|jgi:hypothetical protein|nr:hypothetical protein [Culturomica sp.]
MVFGYSFWWIVPILFISIAVARFKYRKLLKLPDVKPALALGIALLRFLTVLTLLFLLLRPALSFLRHLREKPLLLIAQDNSASLLNNKDSLYYRNEYPEFLRKQAGELEEKFTVEWLTFGKNTDKNNDIDFSGTATDISGVFDYAEQNYAVRRPEALVLLSDGVYNSGVNPRYKTIGYPVYTVGLGDTAEIPDVFIRQAEYDKFNFVKTIFPVKAQVAAVKQKGKAVRCVLRDYTGVLGEQTLRIDSDNFLGEVTFRVAARTQGIHKYTITLETGFEERSKENNRRDLYIHIIDNTGEILIAYGAPHPDVAAISEALRPTGIYNVTSHDLSLPLPAGSPPLLYILHNPRPDDRTYLRIAEEAEKRKTALWYILTDRTSIEAFAGEYRVHFLQAVNEYASPAYNRDFPYFELSAQEVKGYETYPPVVVPFGGIDPQAGKPLFTQNIKNTPTAYGLMCFYDRGGRRTTYNWGEGFWRWRLYSYRETGSHDLFNTLVHKTVHYLTSRKGNERFIHDIKPLYDETEEVVIQAELYNESYELVNTPDVRLTIRSGEKEYNYTLNRNGEKYRISLGNLAPGEYGYLLSANLREETFEQKGSFYVNTFNQELNDLVSDWSLLDEIAQRTGGKSVTLSQIDELFHEMRQNSRFVPVTKSEWKYLELNELAWLGILLLLLLCIEWFLLKYYAA